MDQLVGAIAAVICMPVMIFACMFEVPIAVLLGYAKKNKAAGDDFWRSILCAFPFWCLAIGVPGWLLAIGLALRGPRTWCRYGLASFSHEFTCSRLYIVPWFLKWLPWGSRNRKLHAFATHATPPYIWCNMLGARKRETASSYDEQAGATFLDCIRYSVVSKTNGYNCFVSEHPPQQVPWPKLVVDAREETGATALFFMFQALDMIGKDRSTLDTLKRMFENGFDPNAQDRNGNTALMTGRMAGTRHAMAAMRLIVQHKKYDWNTTNNEGHTATMYWHRVANRIQKPASEGQQMLELLCGVQLGNARRGARVFGA